MPVYAFGVNDQEGPFAFGSSKPPLQIKWSISNKETAVLKPLYQEVCICIMWLKMMKYFVNLNHALV